MHVGVRGLPGVGCCRCSFELIIVTHFHSARWFVLRGELIRPSSPQHLDDAVTARQVRGDFLAPLEVSLCIGKLEAYELSHLKSFSSTPILAVPSPLCQGDLFLRCPHRPLDFPRFLLHQFSRCLCITQVWNVTIRVFITYFTGDYLFRPSGRETKH